MSVLKELLEGAYQVCKPCGLKYGRLGREMQTGEILQPASTFYKGPCDICDNDTMVTEFHDFGYERKLQPREKFTKEHLKK